LDVPRIGGYVNVPEPHMDCLVCNTNVFSLSDLFVVRIDGGESVLEVEWSCRNCGYFSYAKETGRESQRPEDPEPQLYHPCIRCGAEDSETANGNDLCLECLELQRQLTLPRPGGYVMADLVTPAMAWLRTLTDDELVGLFESIDLSKMVQKKLRDVTWSDGPATIRRWANGERLVRGLLRDLSKKSESS
jgi:hypothetical protein